MGGWGWKGERETEVAGGGGGGGVEGRDNGRILFARVIE